MKLDTSLEEKVTDIQARFDINYLLQEVEDSSVIKKYYQTNKLTYRLFHNWTGFLHMGISEDNVYKKSDLLAQAQEIDQYIKSQKAQNVLELGSGRGANSFYLAKNNPETTFHTIDLSTTPLPRYHHPHITFHLADYHDLSIFEDNSFDIVFAIETVCHSEHKNIVLHEIYKKLKPGGLVIIYDGYLNREKSLLTPKQRIATVLIEKGMALNQSETLKSFQKSIKKSRFTIQEEENLSINVLPTMHRFERKAYKFFHYTLLRKILTKLLPETVIRNSFAGYLMPSSIKEGIYVYIKHILRK